MRKIKSFKQFEAVDPAAFAKAIDQMNPKMDDYQKPSYAIHQTMSTKKDDGKTFRFGGGGGGGDNFTPVPIYKLNSVKVDESTIDKEIEVSFRYKNFDFKANGYFESTTNVFKRLEGSTTVKIEGGFRILGTDPLQNAAYLKTLLKEKYPNINFNNEYLGGFLSRPAYPGSVGEKIGGENYLDEVRNPTVVVSWDNLEGVPSGEKPNEENLKQLQLNGKPVYETIFIFYDENNRK